MSEPIRVGDTISVSYTGKFENGEVFDTSEGRAPLKFTVGAGQLIAGFDKAVLDMKAGDKKSFTVSPEEGYGEHRDDLIIDMPRTYIPPDMELYEGLQVQLQDNAGNPIPAIVTVIGDDAVKMDVNHPLAGKILSFDIEIVETGLEPDLSGCGEGGCGGCNVCG
jgi:peptidylprolyl isomerase